MGGLIDGYCVDDGCADEGSNEGNAVGGEGGASPLPSSGRSLALSITPEMTEVMRASQKMYRRMFASSAAVTEAYSKLLPLTEAALKAVNNTTASLTSLPDYSFMLKGMLPAISRCSEMVCRARINYDFGAFYESIGPVALKAQRIVLLDRANWPLYLVDDSAICAELDLLDDDMADDELRDRVSKIAADNLGSEWLGAMQARWGGHDELEDGVRGMLLRALDRHASGDYEGCVALLMNLFEGLLCKYAPTPETLGAKEVELFDWHAKRYQLSPSLKKKGGLRNLENAKDKALLLVISSDSGWLALDSTLKYIIGVTLTNAMDDEIAAHNPLRNKICHGAQTEYGTLEHSLKAILVTDIVIRYGAAALEGQVDSESEN